MDHGYFFEKLYSLQDEVLAIIGKIDTGFTR
jgi:hypothetical protein